jgi:ATP-dependent Clp protease ATP-binding subunit ClpC
LREEEGIAARVLEGLRITAGDVRADVRRIVGEGDEPAAGGQIPFTPRAKKVLELSLREAQSLGHNYIGTEHILLGLARENDGVAARILLELDADAERIRSEVVRMLGGRPGGVRALPQREWTGYAPITERVSSRPFLFGWLLFAVALAVGILVGWLIWGA